MFWLIYFMGQKTVSHCIYFLWLLKVLEKWRIKRLFKVTSSLIYRMCQCGNHSDVHRCQYSYHRKHSFSSLTSKGGYGREERCFITACNSPEQIAQNWPLAHLNWVLQMYHFVEGSVSVCVCVCLWKMPVGAHVLKQPLCQNQHYFETKL